MTPCTLWYRSDPFNGEMRFNHLEDGHCEGRMPTPKAHRQRSIWYGAWWDKKHAWLTDQLPARVVHYSPEEAA